VKKEITTIAFVVGIALAIALMEITSVQAMTLNFSWNGNDNYSAIGSFSYDENTAPVMFSEKGFGTTKVLQSLQISFFDNSNHLLATYNNVINGKSTNNYFRFNFNTVKKEMFGFLDLGGELPGEIYLQGTVNNNLKIVYIPESDSDVILDSNSGSIAVKAGS
jgi:hypothetical protein